METARNGSPVALGHLFVGVERYLLRIATKQMHRELLAKESATDLVQATFLEAMRDLQAFRGSTEASFRQWLKHILVNNIRDVSGGYHAQKRDFDREVPLKECNAIPLIDGRESPTESITRDEQSAALQDAMALLSKDLLAVVKLRYEGGKSFPEIAQILNISDMAAQKRWHRAIAQIRGLVGN